MLVYRTLKKTAGELSRSTVACRGCGTVADTSWLTPPCSFGQVYGVKGLFVQKSRVGQFAATQELLFRKSDKRGLERHRLISPADASFSDGRCWSVDDPGRCTRLLRFGLQMQVLRFEGVCWLLLDSGVKLYELSVTAKVFRYEVSGCGNEGSMSGTTIDPLERSQIIRYRLFVKFLVTPLVFFLCWRTSTYAVALGPEEMNGLGWRCVSSLTAACVAASIAVGFVKKKE